MKLGLLPPDPSLPKLRLADFLTGALPEIPASADYLQGLAFGLYSNDRFGVCGPTSLANYRRLVTARLTGAMDVPTQEEVFDLYRRSGNPNFDPRTGRDDNGVVMQRMLAASLKGGLGGDKPLGFAAVDPKDVTELRAATALFGGVLFGVSLTQANMGQVDSGVWDVRPSAAVGGHAIVSGALSPAGIDVITWAKRVRMTDRFVREQSSEAWVVVWPEHLRSRTFVAGVDLAELAAAYQTLTGRPFPAPIPKVEDLDRDDFRIL